MNKTINIPLHLGRLYRHGEQDSNKQVFDQEAKFGVLRRYRTCSATELGSKTKIQFQSEVEV